MKISLTKLIIFREEYVILGTPSTEERDHILDVIVLLSKFHIYKCKVDSTKPTLSVLNNMIKMYSQIESQRCINQNDHKRMQHEKVWSPYRFLL